MSFTKKAILIITVGLILVVGLGFASLIRKDLPASQIDPKYTNAASQFITLPSGQRAHIRDQGRKNAAPIILLHGSNASLHGWEPWVEQLSNTYRIITVDLPGHGLTGPSTRDDYSIGAYLNFVDEVAQKLNLEQFVLGGSSMGGNIGWRYALQYPEKVRGLILVDSGGYPVKDSDGPIIFSLLQYAPLRLLFQNIHLQRLVEQGVRNAYNNSPVVTQKLIQRYEDLNLREGQRRATALRFAEYAAHPRSPPPRGSLNLPTLILWGKEDKLISPTYAKKFHRDLPNSSLVIYDNVGHMPQEEIPGRSARDVRTFLEGMSWSTQQTAPQQRKPQ